ncbi:hypothetical protein [Variovorax atrisoli]|uniref:hypothetical protein n=1 Tax=Variovorax atrisoli TaxID=3394203 RepID=UPI0033971DDE
MHSIKKLMRVEMTTGLKVLVFVVLTCSGTTQAFKLGGSPEPADAPPPVQGLALDIHFGDPIHEDMTKASLALALSQARTPTGKMACRVSAEAIDRYLEVSGPIVLSHRMCCQSGASSIACDDLKAAGQDGNFFDVSLPLISGVRWNDDICHMSHARRSGLWWLLGWMTGLDIMRFNNVNYASHYHEWQFLHAMAPIARSDSPNIFQDADTTYKRILMWTELAFRVAEGTIPAHATLEQAKQYLEPRSHKGFNLAFRSYAESKIKISFLFTGVDDASDAQVRLMALGALLHTLQDSFSSSHVEREFDPVYRMKPLVGGKGRIVRFHTYRVQSPSRHGIADHRPLDLEDTTVGKLHPVALGAEFIACAVSGQTSGHSQWIAARDVAGRSFELARPGPNLGANAGKHYQGRISDGTEAP